jgi:hypothetical protein
LISDEEQQTAVGMIDTLFKHERGKGWSSISTGEMQKKYQASLAKQKKGEKLNVGDLTLLKGMDLAQGQTGKSAEDVTTKDLVSALSTDMGQSGMSTEKIVSNLNNGGDGGGVISVLERIKGSLDELVRITAQKAGAKSKIKVGDDSNTSLKFSDISGRAKLPPDIGGGAKGLTEEQKKKLAQAKRGAGTKKAKKLTVAEQASNRAARIKRGKAWRARNKTASGMASVRGMRNALGVKFTSKQTKHRDSNVKDIMLEKTEAAARRREEAAKKRAAGVDGKAEGRKITEKTVGAKAASRGDRKTKTSDTSRQVDNIASILEAIKQALSSKEKVITSGTQNKG